MGLGKFRVGYTYTVRHWSSFCLKVHSKVQAKLIWYFSTELRAHHCPCAKPCAIFSATVSTLFTRVNVYIVCASRALVPAYSGFEVDECREKVHMISVKAFTWAACHHCTASVLFLWAKHQQGTARAACRKPWCFKFWEAQVFVYPLQFHSWCNCKVCRCAHEIAKTRTYSGP